MSNPEGDAGEGPRTAETGNSIILVAGLGRCGSSLVMRMLDTAGVPTVGDRPDYEDEIIDHSRVYDPEHWLNVCAGKAVKILDPHRDPPPKGNYRTIWLTRDPEQQARSMLKLIGASPSRRARKSMEKSVRKDVPRAWRALASAGAINDDTIELCFERLVADPRGSALSIAHFLGRDPERELLDKMATCVVPRGPHCLPFMLEEHLIAGAA